MGAREANLMPSTKKDLIKMIVALEDDLVKNEVKTDNEKSELRKDLTLKKSELAEAKSFRDDEQFVKTALETVAGIKYPELSLESYDQFGNTIVNSEEPEEFLFLKILYGRVK